jgi:hypothetical protein
LRLIFVSDLKLIAPGEFSERPAQWSGGLSPDGGQRTMFKRSSLKQFSCSVAATALAASCLGNAVALANPDGAQLIAVTADSIVQGAQVNIVAQWNEAKTETGRYQAPQGFIIKSAVPVVRSETRSSSHVTVSADKREASLVVTVRGQGEFWNKARGWFDGYLNIELVPAE